MKYIIMCGGKYTRKNFRQLIEINGEPIVARTIRLLRENGIEDIAISATSERFEGFGVPVLHHDNNFVEGVQGSWVDGFYPMESPVCYVMGDVVFSPEAIRTIVETETDGIQFFASAPPYSSDYMRTWEEPFAFKVVDTERFFDAIGYTRENKHLFAREPLSWELWQVIKGSELNKVEHNYVEIHDYTCDVDSRDEQPIMERIVQKYEVKHG